MAIIYILGFLFECVTQLRPQIESNSSVKAPDCPKYIKYMIVACFNKYNTVHTFIQCVQCSPDTFHSIDL